MKRETLCLYYVHDQVKHGTKIGFYPVMRRILFLFFVILSSLSVNAQLPDSMRTKKVYPVKIARTGVAEHRTEGTILQRSIYGDYKISGYSVQGTKAPSNEELNGLVGSYVHVDSAAITGTMIDPMTYAVFEIEVLKRDDYLFRTFGLDKSAALTDLPDQFNVHKTDNERCYGIAESGNGTIVFPYKGVLLYLSRN